MNQFDEARLRNEKRLERLARAKTQPEAPKKNPDIDVVRIHPKAPEAMTLRISGPCEMTLYVDYAGTLTAGQQNEKELKALFKKCLLPIGRVRDAT